MGVTLDQVRKLRDKTSAGILDCKKALAESDGDLVAAVEYLRKKGISKASKLVTRKAGEGLVHSYIHPGGRIGVLLEINCETDFVARTDEFKTLVNDIALQIAGNPPFAVNREDLSEELIEKEKEVYRSQAIEAGRPEKVIDKIIEGKLEKFYEDSCLMEQAFVKDPDRKIGDLVKEFSGKVGENVVIRRFARFQLGETA
ncbi:translation elongation factor Ts [Candidatus Eisenbacteria bacterium]|uniref:Elongation factor Ts n=1 Tax=Eiseniibacteriota bacterium TaxID=2212470 RepID=A0ABV6YPX6_UNCEI